MNIRKPRNQGTNEAKKSKESKEARKPSNPRNAKKPSNSKVSMLKVMLNFEVCPNAGISYTGLFKMPGYITLDCSECREYLGCDGLLGHIHLVETLEFLLEILQLFKWACSSFECCHSISM